MKKVVTRSVPCGGCTRCCHGEAIYLHPERGDDPSRYKTFTTRHPMTGAPVQQLRHKPNGDCIHLTAGACEVYDARPSLCREFDCRRFVTEMPESFLRTMSRDPGFRPVIERGRELLRRGAP